MTQEIKVHDKICFKFGLTDLSYPYYCRIRYIVRPQINFSNPCLLDPFKKILLHLFFLC
jgi:hypothetical protein